MIDAIFLKRPCTSNRDFHYSSEKNTDISTSFWKTQSIFFLSGEVIFWSLTNVKFPYWIWEQKFLLTKLTEHWFPSSNIFFQTMFWLSSSEDFSLKIQLQWDGFSLVSLSKRLSETVSEGLPICIDPLTYLLSFIPIFYRLWSI